MPFPGDLGVLGELQSPDPGAGWDWSLGEMEMGLDSMDLPRQEQPAPSLVEERPPEKVSGLCWRNRTLGKQTLASQGKLNS